MDQKQKKTLRVALARFAIDFKKFLSEHDYGDFNFNICLKEGGLVHSYSTTGKTTHGPIPPLEGHEIVNLKEILDEIKD